MYLTTPIEFAKYASKLLQPDICTCAEVGAERHKDTLKTHHIVLSICGECMRMGKTDSQEKSHFQDKY